MVVITNPCLNPDAGSAKQRGPWVQKSLVYHTDDVKQNCRLFSREVFFVFVFAEICFWGTALVQALMIQFSDAYMPLGLTVIQALISNCNNLKVWDLISSFIGHVISYPCWEQSYIILSTTSRLKWARFNLRWPTTWTTDILDFYNRQKCPFPYSTQNAPLYNRNVHMCAHFCYKVVHCGVFVLHIMGFVRWIYCEGEGRALKLQHRDKGPDCEDNGYQMKESWSNVCLCYGWNLWPIVPPAESDIQNHCWQRE